MGSFLFGASKLSDTNELEIFSVISLIQLGYNLQLKDCALS